MLISLARRKKMRCPGEKPNCSHCVRLDQACEYPEKFAQDAGQSGDQKSNLELRLAELEKRLDTMQERSR